MALKRSGTFFVEKDKQQGILDNFKKEQQQLSEAYDRNRPLCFSARSSQRPHPGKFKQKAHHRDADVCLGSRMILGVADGVSQIEDFGIDASLLPKELLQACDEIADEQLVAAAMPPAATNPLASLAKSFSDNTVQQGDYQGPVPLLREAFESTDSLGSTTVVLAMLDNSTRIHGKLHPMVAVITVGDCELIMLRRLPDRKSELTTVFYTEMQRIDGHAQTPLQLARVDERIDPEFHDGVTVEVIERGSAVHCVSAYEGDIIVMGSDGVFDNLFLDEIIDICNRMLPPQPGKYRPLHPQFLQSVADTLIQASHSKTSPGASGEPRDTPIGPGGKMDDTSCVVAEVVPWTTAHRKAWVEERSWVPEPFWLCKNECADVDAGEECEG